MSNAYNHQPPHTPNGSSHSPHDYLGSNNNTMYPTSPNSTPEYHQQQGYYEDKRADSPYYQEESDARGSGWLASNTNNNDNNNVDAAFDGNVVYMFFLLT